MHPEIASPAINLYNLLPVIATGIFTIHERYASSVLEASQLASLVIGVGRRSTVVSNVAISAIIKSSLSCFENNLLF